MTPAPTSAARRAGEAAALAPRWLRPCAIALVAGLHAGALYALGAYRASGPPALKSVELTLVAEGEDAPQTTLAAPARAAALAPPEPDPPPDIAPVQSMDVQEPAQTPPAPAPSPAITPPPREVAAADSSVAPPLAASPEAEPDPVRSPTVADRAAEPPADPPAQAKLAPPDPPKPPKAKVAQAAPALAKPKPPKPRPVAVAKLDTGAVPGPALGSATGRFAGRGCARVRA